MKLLAAASLGLVLSACQMSMSNHSVRGGVDLAAGGEAVGTFRAHGVDRLHVSVDNRGPGQVSFRVTDEHGREIEAGAIDRKGRNFTWRPLESFVVFTVRATGKPANLEYRVTSTSSMSVEWDLSRAQRP